MPARLTSLIASRRYAAAGLACWAAFTLVWWLVHAGALQDFDREGLLLWRSAPSLMPAGPPWLTDAMRGITQLGSVVPRNAVALVALFVLMFLKLRREALLFAGAVLGAWLFDWLVKLAVARPRPRIVPHLIGFSGMSFPSGHSFNAAAIYLAMAFAFGAISARRDVRLAVVSIAVVLSMLVALSRIWLGVHWPSDVIAGWLGGAGCALMARSALQRPGPAHFS